MSLQRAEAARRRLLNSTCMIVDQAANGGLDFRARRFQQFVVSHWLRDERSSGGADLFVTELGNVGLRAPLTKAFRLRNELTFAIQQLIGD